MGFGNDFLDMAHKAQVTIKIKQVGPHQTKMLLRARTHTHTQETFNEVKKP